jgi:hypothetical protein
MTSNTGRTRRWNAWASPSWLMHGVERRPAIDHRRRRRHAVAVLRVVRRRSYPHASSARRLAAQIWLPGQWRTTTHLAAQRPARCRLPVSSNFQRGRRKCSAEKNKQTRNFNPKEKNSIKSERDEGGNSNYLNFMLQLNHQ